MYISALLKSTVVQEIYSDHQLKSSIESFKFVDFEVSSSLEMTPLRDYSLMSQLMDYSGDWSIQSSFESPNNGDISIESSYSRASDSVDFSLVTSFVISIFSSYMLTSALVYNYAVDHSIKTLYRKVLMGDFEFKSYSRKNIFSSYSLDLNLSLRYAMFRTCFVMSSSFISRKRNRFGEKLSFLDSTYVYSSLKILPTLINNALYPIGSQSIQISNELGYYRAEFATVEIVKNLDLIAVSKRIAIGRNITRQFFEGATFDYVELTHESPDFPDFMSNLMEMVITREVHEQHFSDADFFGLDVHVKRFDIPRTTALAIIGTEYISITYSFADSMFFEIMHSLYGIKEDDFFSILPTQAYFIIDRAASKLVIVDSLYSTAIKGYTEGVAILIRVSDTNQYGINLGKNTAKRVGLSGYLYYNVFLLDIFNEENTFYSSILKIHEYMETEIHFDDPAYSYTGRLHSEYFTEIIYKADISISAEKVMISESCKIIGILLEDQLIPQSGFEYGLDVGSIHTNVFFSNEFNFKNTAEAAIVDLDIIVSDEINFNIKIFSVVTDLDYVVFDLSCPLLESWVMPGYAGNFKYKDMENLETFTSAIQDMEVNMFFHGEDVLYYFSGEKETL